MGKQKKFLEEIKQRMPGALEGVPKEYENALFRVSEFLKSEAVGKLNLLEEAMQKEIGSRHQKKIEPPPSIEEMRAAFKKRPNVKEPTTTTTITDVRKAVEAFQAHRVPKLFQHVLTAVLAAHEKELGFKSGATYLGFVEPEEFRQRLTEGTPFKDPAVPGGHGEFTHRMQWYLITKALEPPKDGSWVEFYKWIGTVKHTVEVDKDQKDWQKLGLWDLVVDRNKSDRANITGPYNTDADTDFRSPENLHHYIIETLPADCPVLTSFISRRDFKRMATGLLGPEPDLAEAAVKDYAAKKMFGNRDFDHLETHEKEQVQSATEKAILP